MDKEYINQKIRELSLDIPKPKIKPPNTRPHRLIIGYDKSETNSCLVIGQQFLGSDETWLVNEFVNEDADKVYELLTTPNVKPSLIEQFTENSKAKML